MEVAIYYTDRYQNLPNGIEVINIPYPYEESFRFRVGIRESLLNPGTYGFSIEKLEQKRGDREENWNSTMILEREANSLAGYQMILRRDVDCIFVDGNRVWDPYMIFHSDYAYRDLAKGDLLCSIRMRISPTPEDSRSIADTGQYDISIVYTLENIGDKPVAIEEAYSTCILSPAGKAWMEAAVFPAAACSMPAHAIDPDEAQDYQMMVTIGTGPFAQSSVHLKGSLIVQPKEAPAFDIPFNTTFDMAADGTADVRMQTEPKQVDKISHDAEDLVITRYGGRGYTR